jgi:hypothetical protein
MGGSNKSCSTVGYRYFAGLHLVFCHALDRLLQIHVGEKIAWSGQVAANTALHIDEPNLFGGEEREGGVRGQVDVCFGRPDQGVNSYLQSLLGPRTPAYRGLFGLVARRCMVAANNPYIKGWGILGQRTRIGWRDDLAEITAPDGYPDMNPAHIILETLTNTSWGGLGYPLADIDLHSFQTAANLLAAEQLGLSLIWAKNTSVEDFLQIILDHIDGVLFFSHATGLLTLRLVRADYNIGALPVLDESSIIELVEFTAPNDTEVVNQVVVNFVTRDNRPESVTVHDIAGIARMNGQLNTSTLDFVGITHPALAARIAARELQQLAMPIATCTVVVNRRHAGLEPGDCFSFSWGPLGVRDMVMRVSQIEVSAGADQSVRVTGVRDVYGLGAVAFTEPTGSLWTDPVSGPAPALNRRHVELTWWQFVQVYGDSDAVLAELHADSTLLTSYCARPSGDALHYEMWTRNTGATDWVLQDADSFPYWSALVEPVGAALSSTLVLAAPIDPDLVRIGAYAALGSELVGLTAIDLEANTITVDRGVLDTLPVPHAAGTLFCCHQDLHGLDPSPRSEAESVVVRLLPSTPRGRLALEDAPTDTVTLVGRMMRPYPPGGLRICEQWWPPSIGAAEELRLDWAHRSRLLQTVRLNRQDEGDIGPEPGTTYTLRIHGETDSLLREVTGLATTTYTYAAADESSDSGFAPGVLNQQLRVELESVRDGLTSLRMWNITVQRG